MQKTRLNAAHRNLLREFARTNVTAPKEQRANDRAYARAAEHALAIVTKKYPPADMELLAKYKVAVPATKITGAGPDGRFVAFVFGEGAPLLPMNYRSHQSFVFGKTAVAAIEAAQKAKDALDWAVAAKLDRYFALITAARTLEDVIAAWPAAEQCREQITRRNRALVAVSEEDIRFLRRDNAGAAQAMAS